jgi:hypothetical protein
MGGRNGSMRLNRALFLKSELNRIEIAAALALQIELGRLDMSCPSMYAGLDLTAVDKAAQIKWLAALLAIEFARIHRQDHARVCLRWL